MSRGEHVEWFGLDGEWHAATIVAPVEGDRVLIDLGDGALVYASVAHVRGTVLTS